jgi:hypothetical protein
MARPHVIHAYDLRLARSLRGISGGYVRNMGVRGGASMRMGAAPPSSAPESLVAVKGSRS